MFVLHWVYLVFQDRVLRLMSHCFFPLKMYRFLFYFILLHTNRSQTIPMCTSCVFCSEHNYRSDFLKSIQSQFCWFISKNLPFFLQRIVIQPTSSLSYDGTSIKSMSCIYRTFCLRLRIFFRIYCWQFDKYFFVDNRLVFLKYVLIHSGFLFQQ